MPERPQPQSPNKLSFFFAAAMLAAARRPPSPPWGPMAVAAAAALEIMGGRGGRDVEGAGIADPSGRARGHDGGHADDAWAALGAPASRMPPTMTTAPMATAMGR